MKENNLIIKYEEIIDTYASRALGDSNEQEVPENRERIMQSLSLSF